MELELRWRRRRRRTGRPIRLLDGSRTEQQHNNRSVCPRSVGGAAALSHVVNFWSLLLSLLLLGASSDVGLGEFNRGAGVPATATNLRHLSEARLKLQQRWVGRQRVPFSSEFSAPPTKANAAELHASTSEVSHSDSSPSTESVTDLADTSVSSGSSSTNRPYGKAFGNGGNRVPQQRHSVSRCGGNGCQDSTVHASSKEAAWTWDAAVQRFVRYESAEPLGLNGGNAISSSSGSDNSSDGTESDNTSKERLVAAAAGSSTTHKGSVGVLMKDHRGWSLCARGEDGALLHEACKANSQSNHETTSNGRHSSQHELTLAGVPEGDGGEGNRTSSTEPISTGATVGVAMAAAGGGIVMLAGSAALIISSRVKGENYDDFLDEESPPDRLEFSSEDIYETEDGSSDNESHGEPDKFEVDADISFWSKQADFAAF